MGEPEGPGRRPLHVEWAVIPTRSSYKWRCSSHILVEHNSEELKKAVAASDEKI